MDMGSGEGHGGWGWTWGLRKDTEGEDGHRAGKGPPTSLSLSERILISSSYLSSFSEYCENNKHSLRAAVATVTDVYETLTYL